MAGKKKKELNVAGPSRQGVKYIVIAMFVAGAALRILLCWWNPPTNAFDDHYEPILLMMKTGSIPAKDACWQCYHPPVFYGISAIVGTALTASGVKASEILKPLQFANCFYSILTLFFIYLILRKTPLPDFPKAIAFGIACFFPRHIYMSAMNSNDSISYLFVAVSIYLVLLAVERRFPAPLVLTAGIMISLALFTKYTTYAALPAALAPFIILFFKDATVPRKKIIVSAVLMLFLPIALLAAYFASNYKHYGTPLPWNVQEFDPSRTQPRDYSDMSFFTFTPWDGIASPMIVPDRMHSFWTLVYNGMWFDNEPKFLYYMDSNSDWWTRFFAWLRGEAKFPGFNDSMAGLTKATSAGLIGFGLIPFLLLVQGAWRFFKEMHVHWRKGDGKTIAVLSALPMLLIANAAIVIALAIRLPVFSAAKASYFLNSMPALAMFVGYGMASYEKSNVLKWTIAFLVGVVFVLAAFHILHICWAIQQLKTMLFKT
jgi:4-amino-4-deoxy-L-arabinose transferase-like glycosyltransferase